MPQMRHEKILFRPQAASACRRPAAAYGPPILMVGRVCATRDMPRGLGRGYLFWRANAAGFQLDGRNRIGYNRIQYEYSAGQFEPICCAVRPDAARYSGPALWPSGRSLLSASTGPFRWAGPRGSAAGGQAAYRGRDSPAHSPRAPGLLPGGSGMPSFRRAERLGSQDRWRCRGLARCPGAFSRSDQGGLYLWFCGQIQTEVRQ